MDRVCATMRVSRDMWLTVGRPRVLIAGDAYGELRDYFSAHGHTAMSADYRACERPGLHFRGDFRELLDVQQWELVVALLAARDLDRVNEWHWHRDAVSSGDYWWAQALSLRVWCSCAHRVLTVHTTTADDWAFHRFHEPCRIPAKTFGGTTSRAVYHIHHRGLDGIDWAPTVTYDTALRAKAC